MIHSPGKGATMTLRNAQTYAELVRLDATLASTWPTRIDRALQVMADAP